MGGGGRSTKKIIQGKNERKKFKNSEKPRKKFLHTEKNIPAREMLKKSQMFDLAPPPNFAISPKKKLGNVKYEYVHKNFVTLFYTVC